RALLGRSLNKLLIEQSFLQIPPTSKLYLETCLRMRYLKIYLSKPIRRTHMFGSRHCGRDEGLWAGGRGWRRRHGGFGWGDRHGMGGGDMIRAGRMLATGDLRLLALALIAEQPRHGYEIIKVLEDKTAGWYAPSPGIVYPTLTYLEEAGYVTAQSEGAKKRYTRPA